ncbi:MAG: zinc ABC transporter substrate-binding protein, partial [Thermoplasmata archaeon]|nr:zinc ABC transporter substrate-binding protein [Thermoplasmata archaeon]
MNRKQAMLVISALLIAGLFIASAFFTAVRQEEENGIQVVATFYPLAFFAEAIGGDRVSVTTLIPYNTEVHSWQPSTQDIVKVDKADLFIYNGAGLEPWVEEDLLPAVNTQNKVIVECTKGLDLLPLPGEETAGGENDTGEGDHHGTYDPHTWIDPVIARMEAEAILAGLEEADPSNASYYRENADSLFDRFDDIIQEYSVQLANKTVDKIITSHAAYRYLGERYGFQVIGVVGLSADEQPSTSTLAGIADIMEKENITTLYTTPAFSDAYVMSLKSTLEEETGMEVTILPLYTMTGPIDGMDYFDMEEKNLENLKIGLGV